MTIPLWAVTAAVTGIRHIEYGMHRRGDDENCGISKVTSRTDSLANAKY